MLAVVRQTREGGLSNMAPSGEEVLAKVQDVLEDALGVDEDEVSVDATLMGDLGAESIDVLDIMFRLEKAFSIKIPKEELLPAEVMENPDYVVNDRVTAEGLKKLQEVMPHADLSDFVTSPEISRIPDLLTVGTIVKFVQAKLEAA